MGWIKQNGAKYSTAAGTSRLLASGNGVSDKFPERPSTPLERCRHGEIKRLAADRVDEAQMAGVQHQPGGG